MTVSGVRAKLPRDCRRPHPVRAVPARLHRRPPVNPDHEIESPSLPFRRRRPHPGPRPRLRHVSHDGYPADPRLYQELFGFRPGDEWEDFWSEFATEPITLCLNGPDPARGPAWDWQGAACVALAVDDVPGAVALCRQQGVKVLIEPVETRVCWMAWIADPDGNRICLHSRKNGTAG